MIIDPVEEATRQAKMLEALGSVAQLVRSRKIKSFLIMAEMDNGTCTGIETMSDSPSDRYLSMFAYVFQRLGFIRGDPAPDAGPTPN